MHQLSPIPVPASTLTPEQEEIFRLRDQVHDLEEELEALRKELAPFQVPKPPPPMFPKDWRLPRAEEKLLEALYLAPHGLLRHEHAIKVASPEDDRATTMATVRVRMRNLRRRVEYFGVHIHPVYKIGFRMSDDSKLRLRPYVTLPPQ